jgi:hypothetical protein
VLHSGQIEVLLADYQIVALGQERDKVETEGSRGAAGGEAAVGGS